MFCGKVWKSRKTGGFVQRLRGGYEDPDRRAWEEDVEEEEEVSGDFERTGEDG
jgi:hypothetical protein